MMRLARRALLIATLSLLTSAATAYAEGEVRSTAWGTVADWFVAGGTLLVAIVAVFQETIRGWFTRPRLAVSIRGTPPDCVWVPLRASGVGFVSDCVYLRLWVHNRGGLPARSVEVYASSLERQRRDGRWEALPEFPPMNLRWANVAQPSIYFQRIVSQMGKHCNLGHIVDPARRAALPDEDNPVLGLSAKECALSFEVIWAPTNKGNIVGSGNYRLHIIVAAENAKPHNETIEINLPGSWYADPTKMLSDGIGVRIV